MHVVQYVRYYIKRQQRWNKLYIMLLTCLAYTNVNPNRAFENLLYSLKNPYLYI